MRCECPRFHSKSEWSLELGRRAGWTEPQRSQQQALTLGSETTADHWWGEGGRLLVPHAWPVGSVRLGKIDDVIPSRDDATKVRVKCLIGMSGAQAWLCWGD